VACAGVDERARDEAPGIERLAVAGEGEFVLGAAFEVLEGESRQAPARDPPQLLDIQRASKVAARIVAAARGGRLS